MYYLLGFYLDCCDSIFEKNVTYVLLEKVFTHGIGITSIGTKVWKFFHTITFSLCLGLVLKYV